MTETLRRGYPGMKVGMGLLAFSMCCVHLPCNLALQVNGAGLGCCISILS